jgi:hypothetical protein
LVEYNIPTKNNLAQSIEREVSKQVEHFETRQPNFGFVNGQHYYSPVTYTWPDYYNGDRSKWAKFLAFGNTLGLVILNRASGDWLSKRKDHDFEVQGQLAKGAGAMRVLFYIKTRHGANMPGMPDTYREKVRSNLGVSMEEVTRFTNEYIIQSAKAVKEDFGDIFGGVFLDETSPWLDETLQNKVIENYVQLHDQLKQELGHDALIVINPGSNTPKSMMDACDIALTYESDAAKYIDPATKYIHPDHYKGIPSWRFWHVIHGVTKENIDEVFAKADSLGIGNLYVTDRTFKVGDGSEDHPQENPYDMPPSPWVEDRVRAWIKGVLPFEKRLAVLERTVQQLTTEDESPQQ